MNHLLYVLILMSGLGCSSSVSTHPHRSTEDLKSMDEIVLNSLDVEPLKQGTMKKVTEGPVTTEIWSWKEDHGSPFTKTETLIFKNGELISQSLHDPETGVTFSRQFRSGQVFQITRELKDGAELVFLEQGKISGRMFYGKNPECYLYTNGEPRSEKMDVCETRFNTAP